MWIVPLCSYSVLLPCYLCPSFCHFVFLIFNILSNLQTAQIPWNQADDDDNDDDDFFSCWRGGLFLLQYLCCCQDNVPFWWNWMGICCVIFAFCNSSMFFAVIYGFRKLWTLQSFFMGCWIVSVDEVGVCTVFLLINMTSKGSLVIF